MQNKKRGSDEYSNFQVYPEIHFIDELEGEELLCFGIIYNFTGKNTTAFLQGKNVNGVTKAFVSNAPAFNVKKVTRNDVKRLIDILFNKGLLDEGTTYIERTELRGRVIEKKLRPIFISETGMSLVREAIKKMRNPTPANSLF